MKVLIVCSGNAENFSFILHQAFIYEQIEAVKRNFKVEYDTFFIKGKGLTGYLRNLNHLRNKIKYYQPDLIHAHYGLSGLLSVLQFKVPVVVTFHNGEVLSTFTNLLASIVILFSKFDIYVSTHIRERMYFKKGSEYTIIPCGIDLQTIRLIDNNSKAAHKLIDPLRKNVLFGGSFDNPRKNSELAKSAISRIKEFQINLIELKGLSRDEVNLLLNQSDVALLPSKSEGSPQFIKEAMACNCPIVATDVGDIREVISGTDGCYITSFDPDDVAEKIVLALRYGKRTKGRERVKHFDNNLIASQVFKVYSSVSSK